MQLVGASAEKKQIRLGKLESRLKATGLTNDQSGGSPKTADAGKNDHSVWEKHLKFCAAVLFLLIASVLGVLLLRSFHVLPKDNSHLDPEGILSSSDKNAFLVQPQLTNLIATNLMVSGTVFVNQTVFLHFCSNVTPTSSDITFTTATGFEFSGSTATTAEINAAISFDSDKAGEKALLPKKSQHLVPQVSALLSANGITGDKYAAAAPLHYRIHLHQDEFNEENSTSNESSAISVASAQVPINKRALGRGDETCCDVRSFSPEGSKCFGMCGKGCNCWKSVCGNCCAQPGCIWHDTQCHICHTAFLLNPATLDACVSCYLDVKTLLIKNLLGQFCHGGRVNLPGVINGGDPAKELQCSNDCFDHHRERPRSCTWSWGGSMTPHCNLKRQDGFSCSNGGWVSCSTKKPTGATCDDQDPSTVDDKCNDHGQCQGSAIFPDDVMDDIFKEEPELKDWYDQGPSMLTYTAVETYSFNARAKKYGWTRRWWWKRYATYLYRYFERRSEWNHEEQINELKDAQQPATGVFALGSQSNFFDMNGFKKGSDGIYWPSK
jgi:hypothetical protein